MQYFKILFSILSLLILEGCSRTPVSKDGPITSHEKYQSLYTNDKIPTFSIVSEKAKSKSQVMLEKKMEFELKSNSPKLLLSNDNTQFSHYVVLNWKPGLSGQYKISGFSEPNAVFKETKFNRTGTSHFTPKFYLIDPIQKETKELKMEYGICDVACLKVNLKYSTTLTVEQGKSYKLLIVGDTTQEDLVVLQGTGDRVAGPIIYQIKYSLFSSSHGKINFTVTKVE